MQLEKQLKAIKKIGPFEKAQSNLDRFVWNYMLMYTTVTLADAYDKHTDVDSPESKLTMATADLTLQGVFKLILEKDNGVWN